MEKSLKNSTAVLLILNQENMNRVKSLSVFVLYFLYTSFAVQAQQLSARTNELTLTSANAKGNEQLPMITWINPGMELTATQEKKIAAQFTITGPEQVARLSFKLMDTKTNTLLAGKESITLTEKQQQTITQTVHLPSGYLELVLEITTKSGLIIREKRQIVSGIESNDLISLDRKDYALIFATDKYEHWSDLVNPIEDARAIAQELSTNYGFNVEVVENPTVDEVWQKIRSYSEMKFAPQDQLMVFFAGHGHFDETFGEGYVVARNSLNNDLARSSYISHNRLRGVVNNLPCNHVLLMLDVCFGGTLDPVIAKSRSATEELSTTQMLIRKWNYKTRKYITSGGKEYVSDGIPGKHSPFAAKFLEVLNSNGYGDMIVTLPELSGAFERLPQLPRFGSFGDDEKVSDFVFLRKTK
jgi:Caspase domain